MINETREEHVEYCKRRALEYVDAGLLDQALASMGSDLNQHEETRDHPAMHIGLGLMMMGKLNSQEEMRRFIRGFH